MSDRELLAALLREIKPTSWAWKNPRNVPQLVTRERLMTLRALDNLERKEP